MHWRFRGILSLLILVSAGVPATAQNATRGSEQTVSVDEFIARGTDFESQRQWQQAADLYERASRLFPDNTGLKKRLRKAERLYSLSRRYHDSSYTTELMQLSEAQALELYREVLRKIQTHFVEPVSIDRLVQIGYENLDLALDEPVFVSRNFATGQPTSMEDLKAKLAQRQRVRVNGVEGATAEVLHATNILGRNGLTNRPAIVLEFLSAASEGLDPYSTHLSPNRLRDLYATIDGNFVGLGIEVRGAADGLLLLHILPESPAEEAGLKESELIIEVDGKSIAGMPAEEAANLLQGPANTQVTLKLKGTDNQTRVVAVPRREVIVHSVTRSEMIDRDRRVGYIRLDSFQKLTVQELEQAVGKLQAEGMTRLILDLRGNPGGLLDVALHVANHFIDDGVLVSTQGRAWGQSWSHRARPMSRWTFPIVVLVDGNSASASEIFAGAVQDHGRGLVVGTQTFGKGSVQSIFPLHSANTGLRLTTARFYSPKGKTLQGIGVHPDLVVSRPVGPLGEEEPLSREVSLENDRQLREAYQALCQTVAAN